MGAADVIDGGGGEKQPAESQLRVGVRNLDDARGREISILWEKDDVVIENDVAGGVADDEGWCVAMPHQEDLRPCNRYRGVDFDEFLPSPRARFVLHSDACFEEAWSAPLCFGPLELDVEVIESEGEGRNAVCGGESSPAPRVVLGECVGEPISLFDDDVSSPPEKTARRDGHQNQDQR